MPETPSGPTTVTARPHLVEATDTRPVPGHRVRAEIKRHKLRITRRLQVAIVADDDTTAATLLSILADLYPGALSTQAEAGVDEVDAHFRSNTAAGVTS